MFAVVKVRLDQKPGDYKDPGWFKHPEGTVAYDWLRAGRACAQPVRRRAHDADAKHAG